MTPLYDGEDSVCGIVYGGTAYCFLKNLQGDVIALTDADGETLARYRYDAWGKLLSVTDRDGSAISDPHHPAFVNPFRYRSYYYDAETGLYYLQSRYYDPETGRFVNADAVQYGTLVYDSLENNIFVYVRNSPIMLQDITGQAWYFGFNFNYYLPSVYVIKRVYQLLESVINCIKANTKKSLEQAKNNLKNALSQLKSNIKKPINKLFDEIKRFIQKLKTTVKISTSIILVCVIICYVAMKKAASVWNWLTKTKAGQITWNSISVVVSIGGLVVSIIGCATPAAPIAIAGIVFSALSLFGSVISLLMAIFS